MEPVRVSDWAASAWLGDEVKRKVATVAVVLAVDAALVGGLAVGCGEGAEAGFSVEGEVRVEAAEIWWDRDGDDPVE